MSKLWCAVLVAMLSSTALARTLDGADDEKKAGDENRAKSFEELSAELEAQKAQLEAQRLQIQALQVKTAGLSLEGNGALLDPDLQGKPALPEDIKSKWAMNIYGFIEADFIDDNRQVTAAAATNTGAVDGAGNQAWPLGRSYLTEHGALTFGARNSRVGFNISAPEFAGIRASGKLEMDFLGTNGGGSAEANATWVNPTFRIRHMYLTLDNDYVTVTLGQGWELFGWQPYFQPNTVDIQGIPGEVYSRSPKAQFSHKFQGPVDLELAAALSRPPERLADSPDIQAGVKISIPDWVGVHTIGAAGTAIDPAAIGFSGTTRAFQVPNNGLGIVGTTAESSDKARGDAAAVDIFLPILHPDKESKGNSLSITGEYVYGKGISDLYTTFNAGLGNPAANVVNGIGDQGEIGWANGAVGSVGVVPDLKTIQWRTDILGVQYYLPGDGTWWLAANYSTCESNNLPKLSTAPGAPGANLFNRATTYRGTRWINGDLFTDVTPAVRLGLSVDQYRDTYIWTPGAVSHYGLDTRVQFSAFLIF